MKGSEKKVSFSTRPFKPSASSKGSDENYRSDQEMSSNLVNRKKETVKNFMSPTISVASKASFQRKKILAERNVSTVSNFPNTHLSKAPNLDSKSSPKITPKASRKNSPNLDAKFSPQKTPLSYNSTDATPSPRPYDPLTNYLSPRPQFLRYNPGRRKQIFLRLQGKDKEVDDTLSVSSTSSFDSDKVAAGETRSSCGEDCSSSCEGEEFGEETGSLLEQEDEVFDIESDEESEEEVGESRRQGLKYLLLLVVLVLATAYICSMNCPTPTQEFQGLILNYQKIQNYSNGTVESVDAGCKFLNGKPEQVDFLGLNRRILNEGIEEEMAGNITKREIIGLELEDRNHVESPEIVEEVKKDGNIEDVCEEKLVKTADAYDQFAEEKATVERIEYVKENGGSGDIIGDELVETKEVSVQLAKDIELLETVETGERIEDVENVEAVKENGESEATIEEELGKTREVTDCLVRDIEQLGEVYAGMIASKEAVQPCLLSDGNDPQETASRTADSSEKERMVTDPMVRDAELLGLEYAVVTVSKEGGQACPLSGESHHQETASHTSEKESAVTKEAGGEIQSGPTHENMIEGKIFQGWEKSWSLNVEEVNALKGLNQQNGTDVLVKVFFGVLACGTVVAYFLLGFNFKGKVNAFASKLLSSVDKHSTKADVKKKPSVVLPTEREEYQKHFNSLVNTMPLINSTDKDIEESFHRGAPSVELLGELEVEAIHNPSKSCGSKRGMNSEVNSYYDFLSKAYSAPAQVQQDLSGQTSVNFNSSEKLTPKKKLVREVSTNNDTAELDEEASTEVVTPLRRSARIRNRAVTSPWKQ